MQVVERGEGTKMTASDVRVAYDDLSWRHWKRHESKMAGPNELSFDAVRDFILKNGGKVRNHDLVKHFKKFLTRPESRGE